jgi:hypothetical protein
MPTLPELGSRLQREELEMYQQQWEYWTQAEDPRDRADCLEGE